MKKEQIDINASNLNDCLGLDIVAFHWAAPGACGEHGGVIFVTSDGKVYHTNYVYPEYGVSDEDLCKIFPPLSDFHPGIFGGGMYPPEWKDRYLGLGNYLVVKDTLWDEFSDLARSELKRLEEEGQNVILYNIWIDVIINVLNNHNMA